jgi:hypothetical protein
MGKPDTVNPVSSPSELIGWRGDTGGIETSQYPKERKSNRDSLSSGERKGNSPNLHSVKDQSRCYAGVAGDGRSVRLETVQSYKISP